jgi:hypothetical protein
MILKKLLEHFSSLPPLGMFMVIILPVGVYGRFYKSQCQIEKKIVYKSITFLQEKK